MVITIFIELYIKAGIKIFGKFIGVKLSWEYSIVVFDQKWVPDPFPPIAEYNAASGAIDFTVDIARDVIDGATRRRLQGKERSGLELEISNGAEFPGRRLNGRTGIICESREVSADGTLM